MGRISIDRPSTFRQYVNLLRKDLRQEFRTRDMISSMGIYAVLVLVIYGAAFGYTAQSIDVAQMSGGLLWALIVFTSLLGLNRSFSHEREQGCLEGILLVPLDRSVVYLAKATSNLLFLAIVELIAIPLFYFLFLTSVELSATVGFVVPPLILGTVGVAGVGTMLSTITINARGKDVMLAILFIPLVWPLLFACVSATSSAFLGGQFWFDTYGVSVLMAAAYDVIMLLVCWVLYDYAVSA
ncbi:heme ABC transporter permease CcmB [Berryella wangjianweii]|uniref:Heme ABC transporter permease CcmB n=1 Tax=Berryella wangjianweii TaxID=2734634 RepID=A0A6M8J6K4_9ACTN|nr:heme exporter protein CcmB [Berryella wangjianweii]QKF07298.1 heme ABC transporter permease CcmB [Berryella wangjianweii]